MSIQKNKPSQTVTERTHFVGRHSPVNGDASVYILREEITEDGKATNLGECFREPFAKIKERPAAVAYLAACQNAKSIDDLFTAEKNLYDALVAEKENESNNAE
jgi:hypothetical protein